MWNRGNNIALALWQVIILLISGMYIGGIVHYFNIYLTSQKSADFIPVFEAIILVSIVMTPVFYIHRWIKHKLKSEEE